jgi:hypothetical protein
VIDIPDIVRNPPNISDDPKVRDEQMAALYQKAGALAVAAASEVDTIVPVGAEIPTEIRGMAEKAMVTVMFLGVAETIIRRAVAPLTEEDVIEIEKSGAIEPLSSTVAGMAMRLVALNIAGELSDTEAEAATDEEAARVRTLVLLQLKLNRPSGATLH